MAGRVLLPGGHQLLDSLRHLLVLADDLAVLELAAAGAGGAKLVSTVRESVHLELTSAHLTLDRLQLLQLVALLLQGVPQDNPAGRRTQSQLTRQLAVRRFQEGSAFLLAKKYNLAVNRPCSTCYAIKN